MTFKGSKMILEKKKKQTGTTCIEFKKSKF